MQQKLPLCNLRDSVRCTAVAGAIIRQLAPAYPIGIFDDGGAIEYPITWYGVEEERISKVLWQGCDDGPEMFQIYRGRQSEGFTDASQIALVRRS